MKQKYQSSFASEMAEEKQYQFKSKFATDLWNLYRTVEIQEEQTGVARDQDFMEQDFSSEQILNSTARESCYFPLKFGPSERLSTISKVSTVVSFNEDQSKGRDNQLNCDTEYVKLQDEMRDLQEKLEKMEFSQKEHLMTNKEMLLLIQRLTSQLKVQTQRSRRSEVVRRSEGSEGGSSLRRQRGVRARRGESIKKAKPHILTSQFSSSTHGDDSSGDSNTCDDCDKNTRPDNVVVIHIGSHNRSQSHHGPILV